MPKLTRYTTGKVASKVIITADEVRALILEKYPDINRDAEMLVDTDMTDEQTLEGVTFSWDQDTGKPPEEKEIQPAGCRSACRLAEVARHEAGE